MKLRQSVYVTLSVETRPIELCGIRPQRKSKSVDVNLIIHIKPKTLQDITLVCKWPCWWCAGKEVQPVLRYRDADGSVFSETRNAFGRSETTSLLTANPSTPTQSEPESPSGRSASPSASDSDSEDKDEEEVVSHLQRLQGLAGSWRRVNKRPRLGKDGREHRDMGLGSGQQEGDWGGEPEAAAMQVYVHGIDEAALQSALTPSSLWQRIQLNKNLEVGLHLTGCCAVLLVD